MSALQTSGMCFYDNEWINQPTKTNVTTCSNSTELFWIWCPTFISLSPWTAWEPQHFDPFVHVTLLPMTDGMFDEGYWWHISVEVIVLHEDGVDASVDRGEVVNESALFLRRAGKPVVVLHGWRTETTKERWREVAASRMQLYGACRTWWTFDNRGNVSPSDTKKLAV